MKIHHFNGIYQERWGFSWAMLVSGRVIQIMGGISDECQGENMTKPRMGFPCDSLWPSVLANLKNLNATTILAASCWTVNMPVHFINIKAYKIMWWKRNPWTTPPILRSFGLTKLSRVLSIELGAPKESHTKTWHPSMSLDARVILHQLGFKTHIKFTLENSRLEPKHEGWVQMIFLFTWVIF